ncbi:nicotinic acid mononucleotide adenylyltransferase [Salinisphaera sp. PC39]|uniref:nicotinate-nucleotide adenylyltransferase n=1 Tax=Salinisphaera sp. PC39 TaxID=1304156 RepID=UPI00333ED426
MPAPIGILGGTFDPVHNGHLRLAVELAEALELAEVRLVPSARPPHRGAPIASPGQRAKWIRVAITDEPRLRLDDRELLRRGPSYTVDTLASLRRELPDTPLCLLMGRDVMAALDKWHEWRGLFEHAHIVLVERPDTDTELPAAVADEVERRRVGDAADLRGATHGLVHVCTPPPLTISGTRIRELLAAGRSARYLLPDVVLEEIQDAGVYRREPAPA